MEIIRRVESFTLSDSLMKFITAIELVWNEIQVSNIILKKIITLTTY